MNEIFLIFILTLIPGLAMPVGAWLAKVESIRPHWLERKIINAVLAFGGGALISAVALSLVPHGIKSLSILSASLSFLAGGVVFMIIDQSLSKNKTPASNLVAMLSDFLPEAMALGASFARDKKSGLILSILMTFQNLPEGFNAFREMMSADKKNKSSQILFTFLLLSLMGPLAGLGGYYFLEGRPQIIGIIVLFASGGILYTVFQDIAPRAKEKQQWSPALGAVIGFLSGMIVYQIIQS